MNRSYKHDEIIVIQGSQFCDGIRFIYFQATLRNGKNHEKCPESSNLPEDHEVEILLAFQRCVKIDDPRFIHSRKFENHARPAAGTGIAAAPLFASNIG
jgi:hypothetical protein